MGKITVSYHDVTGCAGTGTAGTISWYAVFSMNIVKFAVGVFVVGRRANGEHSTRRGYFLSFGLLFLLWLVAPAVLATERNYLRGYIDALLDNRFASLGLRVQSFPKDREVMLTARGCLGPSQKRDVERLLIATRHVETVRWDETDECVKPSIPGSPPREQAKEAEFKIEIHPLPEGELFASLIADPRQPRFSMSYQRYKTSAQDFDAASVAFGEYFGLAAGFLGKSGASQIGIQAAVFALFNLDAPSSDLINADYWIGFPLSYRKGPWSYLVRIYHQSSHLGDEFILGNPGVNRVNLSYEDLEMLVSYEWQRFRVYGGGGYIINSEPDLAHKHLQTGIEYLRPRALRKLDFIAAIDIQAYEELDWRHSRSYQVGLEFKAGTPRRVRLMLEHFRGHSPNGQFFRERLRYTGLGVYFGF
jgi:hypothetical protein